VKVRVRTWLYRIVVNLCYNQLPKLKQALSVVDVEDVKLADEGLGVERTVLAAEIATELQAAIANLPDTQRLIITLRHQQQMSYDEIATITDLPLGTVKTHIFRARKALKIALLPYLE
jgi:RNA polymerase sigma-70 factor (ECF subfamily)